MEIDIRMTHYCKCGLSFDLIEEFNGYCYYCNEYKDLKKKEENVEISLEEAAKLRREEGVVPIRKTEDNFTGLKDTKGEDILIGDTITISDTSKHNGKYQVKKEIKKNGN